MTFTSQDHEQRKKGIGCSELASLFGMNKYQTPIQLKQLKLGEVEPEEAGDAALYGLRFESSVRKWIEDTHQIKIHHDDGEVFRAKSCPLYAHLDGHHEIDSIANQVQKSPANFLNKSWIIDEIKIPTFWTFGAYGDEGTDKLPERHLLQVAGQVLCVEEQGHRVDSAIVWVDLRPKLKAFPVANDKNLDMLKEIIKRNVNSFWDKLQNGEFIEPTTTKDRERLWPRATSDTHAIANAEDMGVIKKRLAIKEQIDSLKEEDESLSNYLRDRIMHQRGLFSEELDRTLYTYSETSKGRTLRPMRNLKETICPS